MPAGYDIQPASPEDLVDIVEYLADHVRDNGCGETPLFQPLPRGTELVKPDRLVQFRSEALVPVGEPKWRRSWLARDASGAICGHADLRAHPEPHTEHRALLGMGVHRAHRRRGLGRALLQRLSDWAGTATSLVWIDLEVMTGNRAAVALYESAGFQVVFTRRDAYRIDGEPIDATTMTKQIRPAAGGNFG